MRWLVHAYCKKNRAYRDFVPGRLRGAPELLEASIHGRDEDEGWNTEITIRIKPDPRLSAQQKAIIESDYGIRDGHLAIASRGALVQYVLQCFQSDTAEIEPRPAVQQIVVANLEVLECWLYR
ncbi:transcriptional regulator [Azorhizophilus paspali]|uniref:Transcriptional regulator n=1 Tax=Azorhizophilus paspali TaxID=69963 RepID=A0ABV6SLQ8_AZOPA